MDRPTATRVAGGLALFVLLLYLLVPASDDAPRRSVGGGGGGVGGVGGGGGGGGGVGGVGGGGVGVGGGVGGGFSISFRWIIAVFYCRFYSLAGPIIIWVFLLVDMDDLLGAENRQPDPLDFFQWQDSA